MMRSIRGQPLFAPLLPWLSSFDCDHEPAAIEALNRAALQARIKTGSGAGLSFVVPGGSGLAFEERVYWLGEVEVRPGNWHDFFNALVWLAFPLTKATLNSRHHGNIAHLQPTAEQGAARGPARDAITHFDECGVAVVCTREELCQAIRAHRWKEVFWTRRTETLRSMQVFVFGHASYDLLRSPYLGLCGKAVFLDVNDLWLAKPLVERIQDVDRRMAQRFTEDSDPQNTDFDALPLMGIPGATPDNEFPSYYDDTRQFRPLRGV